MLKLYKLTTFLLIFGLTNSVFSQNNPTDIFSGKETSTTLAGTYTVGSTTNGDNFNSIFEAVTNLIAFGASEPVIFEISEYYSSVNETFPIDITAYTGNSAVNTLTIKVKPNITAEITGSTGDDYKGLFHVIAPNVTIDGSNNGDNTRNLTITNTSTKIAYGVFLDGDNCNLKNCNISTTNLINNYAVYAHTNNTNISYNNITSGEQGINVTGQNVYIGHNTINSVFKIGINCYAVDNPIVEYNTISNIMLNTNDICSGIKLSIVQGTSFVNNNKISNIKGIVSQSVAYGISISGFYNGTMNIANNTISNIASGQFTGSFPAGMYFSNPDETGVLKISYNTIYMPQDDVYGIDKISAVNYSSGIYIDAGIKYQLRNNIIHNELGARTTKIIISTSNYAIYASGTANPFSFSNNNLFFAGGNVDYSSTARANNTNMNLLEWQTWSTFDNNSYFENSLLNIDLFPTNCSQAIAQGLYIDEILLDIENAERDLMYPTIGAYEFAGIQAQDISYTVSGKGSGTLSWTSGNGCSKAVFVKAGNVLPEFPAPVNGISYIADGSFGAGDQLGTSGWYCVYDGEGNNFAISNIDGEYTVMVCEYWGNPGNIVYNLTEASNNPRTFNSALNIENISNNIDIYPNPANDFIFIRNLENIKSISISDISGKIISENEYKNSNEISIDISKMAKGIYFIKLTDNKNIFTKKIIKI